MDYVLTMYGHVCCKHYDCGDYVKAMCAVYIMDYVLDYV